MEKREQAIEYFECKNLPSGEYRELCEKAQRVLPDAYSAYSGFSVGAALLLENGEVITGTNQENAALPSGMCAERTALFYAGSRFPQVRVRAMAIAAADRNGPVKEYVAPCGACRQVMAETIRRGGDFDVILCGEERTILLRASALLPFPFEDSKTVRLEEVF
ncbi:MAG: cytidine deaminase [Culturomica sp.]|nr:cytidine deaminase [Culturomica sp.]